MKTVSMAMPELSAALEALLFVADQPLRVDRLAEILECEKSAVQAGLDALATEYLERRVSMLTRSGSSLKTSPRVFPVPRWKPWPSLPTGSRSPAPRLSICAESIREVWSKPCSSEN